VIRLRAALSSNRNASMGSSGGVVVGLVLGETNSFISIVVFETLRGELGGEFTTTVAIFEATSCFLIFVM